MMKTKKLDILLLAEVHNNTNATETHDDFIFVFSTSVTDKQRKEAEDTRAAAKMRGPLPSQFEMNCQVNLRPAAVSS